MSNYKNDKSELNRLFPEIVTPNNYYSGHFVAVIILIILIILTMMTIMMIMMMTKMKMMIMIMMR
jgi:hypothetical protein